MQSEKDEKRRLDPLVWNKAQALLEDAEGDVLEIFDWYLVLQLSFR